LAKGAVHLDELYSLIYITLLYNYRYHTAAARYPTRHTCRNY